MSRDLLTSYERDFEICMNQLRGMLDDPSDAKLISSKNPYEYDQAQNYLKQMEIESMNYMEAGYDNSENDNVRARIQKHKQEFNAIRREMRQMQQAYEKQHASISTRDQEMSDLESSKVNNQVFRQRQQLEDAKQVGYACEDMAADIKVNLKGQSDKMQNRTLKNLFDIQDQAGISGKLLDAIQQQRARNKYVLYGVYGVLSLLVMFVLYQMFGFLLPSFSAGPADDVTEG